MTVVAIGLCGMAIGHVVTRLAGAKPASTKPATVVPAAPRIPRAVPASSPR
jgi:hypothetical protein